MGYAVWQHTRCGYIHSDALACAGCNSRVIYVNEKRAWCPYCEKVIEGVTSYTKCKGCGETNISDSEVRFLPF